jgi:DNA repair protein RadA/Sms
MVDTVLYFEGERGHHFRILRTVNRFGPTDEIGVFEMSDRVSAMSPILGAVPGRWRGHVSAPACSPASRARAGADRDPGAGCPPPRHAAPRRGRLDPNRLAMVLAVLEARCGVAVSGNDVYLNVAGGLRIGELAADLAAAAAVVSSLADEQVPADTVVR